MRTYDDTKTTAYSSRKSQSKRVQQILRASDTEPYGLNGMKFCDMLCVLSQPLLLYRVVNTDLRHRQVLLDNYIYIADCKTKVMNGLKPYLAETKTVVVLKSLVHGCPAVQICQNDVTEVIKYTRLFPSLAGRVWERCQVRVTCNRPNSLMSCTVPPNHLMTKSLCSMTLLCSIVLPGQ